MMQKKLTAMSTRTAATKIPRRTMTMAKTVTMATPTTTTMMATTTTMITRATTMRQTPLWQLKSQEWMSIT